MTTLLPARGVAPPGSLSPSPGTLLVPRVSGPGEQVAPRGAECRWAKWIAQLAFRSGCEPVPNPSDRDLHQRFVCVHVCVCTCSGSLGLPGTCSRQAPSLWAHETQSVVYGGGGQGSPGSTPCAYCPSGHQTMEGLLPGDLVCAGHGDKLLAQQDAVPRLYCAGSPDGHGALSRLNLRAQVPTEFPDDVFAAGH